MDETLDADLKAFYQQLLSETRSPIYRTGEWPLYDMPAWRGNYSNNDLLAYCWCSANMKRPDGSHINGSAATTSTIGSEEFRLIVINLTDGQAQEIVSLNGWQHLRRSGLVAV